MTLHGYIEACRDRPFQPGTHDCARFVAGWVAARTGRDPGAGYRYRTLRAGQAALRRKGHADHIALAAALLEEVHPARAREGDVAVVDVGDGPALGICGGEVVYLVGAAGLHLAPRAAMIRAFRCPR